MATVTAPQLAAELKSSSPRQWVDVRSATEFAAGHIPGAVNIPMDQFEARLADLSPHPIVLICKGGKRARMVAALVAPCRDDVTILEGGTDAWIKASLPLVVSTKTRWSLERQVRLGAGVFMLIGLLLALAVNRNWLALTGLVGLGLTFADLTDFCPLAMLLAGMPWNRPMQCPSGAIPKEKECCM